MKNERTRFLSKDSIQSHSDENSSLSSEDENKIEYISKRNGIPLVIKHPFVRNLTYYFLKYYKF